MKKAIICLVLVLGFAIGCSSQSSITLEWTAVGDDGMLGRASQYDLRYSSDSTLLVAWDSALVVTGEPIPKPSGELESFSVGVVGLISGVKYYFAIKVGDEVSNWSTISNIASFTINDNIPPNAVTTLIIKVTQ